VVRVSMFLVAGLLATAGDAVAQDAGRKVFEGKGNCHVCHGKDAKGTTLAPDLTDSEWLNVDGSLAAVVALIESGVARPVRHPTPMPPLGGAKLSKEEVAAVAAYVKSLSPPK
jgi:mono/diheme cytochrome c family protein